MNVFTLQFETNTLDNNLLGIFFTVKEAMEFAEEAEKVKNNSLTWEPFFETEGSKFNVGFSDPCDEVGSYYAIEKMEIQGKCPQ